MVDPATLRHIVVPHFEGDERGAMNQSLKAAPHAEVLGRPIAARGSPLDFAIRPPRMVQDGELIGLGGERLRILMTPQVHGWDALLAVERTTGTLLSPELFMQPRRGPAITEEDRTEAMIVFSLESNLIPSKAHLHAAPGKIEPLGAKQIACHHGSTIAGRVIPEYYRAIRDDDVTVFER